MKNAKTILDSDKKGGIGDKFRSKRFLFLEQCLDNINGPIRILDVGGAEYFWENRDFHLRENIHITLLNLNKTEVKYHNFESIIGNATDLSEYLDNSFDLVFSNSVIEHLYTWENQQKMARECQRVGKYYFVQTPNKYFFLEPHYLLPFFQFIPKKIGFWILTRTKLSRGYQWTSQNAEQYLDEIRLLDRREIKFLFPQSKIYTEKFIGLKKSFTAHNFVTN
jgi:2-polyprenyl-3-methyl-5-hydroxy-6-metoxy-1,4-benzoquinol methylase